ncbi:hypothetical protein AGOR_G00039680 [Albula goreensis]|uniref:Uncharacterized protein n=1 Tax=Albula goreensis TaxID=1534307 RepID=A0A8T3E4Y6_9TELE|nr:hypothetical protein AGOR_G00039680 [Albula goreensis]
MEMISRVVFSILLSLVAAKLRVKEEAYTAFFREDVHLQIPSLKTTEVLFKPSVGPVGSEQVLMRDGQVVSSRTKLNPQLSHLILEDVGEEDEGVYVIKCSDTPGDIKHIVLIVRDCAIEHNFKYGETYHIPLTNIPGPVTLEFRPSVVPPNQTSDPVVLLLNHTWEPTEEYKGRLTATERRVSLHGVTGSDEGSYTMLDSEGKVRKRTCLNVKEHQNFVRLPYAGTLKINLILDHSKVRVLYTPDSDRRERLIVEHGELVVPMDPSLDKRLSLDGSMCILERVRFSDSGLFRVTDLQGLPVSNVYLEVEAYKLPTLYVAIISLVSLLVFLLLMCLLSCLIKVRRRAERARAIARIAREAGKGDGEAFRQVVHEAYTRFTEESTTRSQWDSNTDNTEVEIKGLEVSKGGRYHTLTSDKSDSGFPLDSDTDGPPTFVSHKLLLTSDLLNGTTTPEVILSTNQTPESQPSGSPILQTKQDTSPKAGSPETAGVAPVPETDASGGPVTEDDKDSAMSGEEVASQDIENTAA